jgi:bifunctional NMN adenylyltransferase/nudix hydrolase
MTKNKVFIGRFQPVHPGHIEVIQKALEGNSRLLILVGSSNSFRSIKNPWTFKERFAKIINSLNIPNIDCLVVKPLNDYKYNDPQWITDVRTVVNKIYGTEKITLVGFDKPGNEYLKWFPDWEYENIPTNYHGCSTDIRHEMFLNKDPAMPVQALDDFLYYEKEAALFKDYPFSDTLNFNCSDAVVECQGHVLVIERKFPPGKGTWALPGGFKNSNETFLDCAVRELKEETGLKVPEKVLRGSIVSQILFDAPNRSCGIPRNTLAVHFRIQPNNDDSLPKLKPQSDATKAIWVPLNDVLNRYVMYSDHRDIISKLTGVMPRPAHDNITNLT